MAAQTIVQPLRRWDPERIGPYAILGKLGAGAIGQVFLARSPAGRLVAVKTIRIELAEEPGFRARFAREVAAASRVSGVFTAAVIEADADADRPWVATAYVPAPTLRTLVRACGPLPVPAVRWLAAGCAEALQSIHGAGLLHRDVKPSNVLVAPDGPRVIDFGVARAAERVQLTTTRGAAGTPAYMAPEQARDASTASPASDVFSLGATLVFAATGHPPYHGETVMDILVRLATEPPDLAGLPGELTGLITSCLERVPRARPTDAAILAALGPFAHVPAAQPGHSYLPGPAAALIGEYQRGPRIPADRASAAGVADGNAGASRAPGGDDAFSGDDDDGASAMTDGSGDEDADVSGAAQEATSGSHTALPGFESPAALHEAPGSPGSPAGPGMRQPPPRLAAGRGRARSPRVWAVPAVVAIALLGAGVLAGFTLRGPGMPPAKATGYQAGSTSPSAGAGSFGQPSCTTPTDSAVPELCVSQPYGDGETVFVVHGNGFVPFKPVTIFLAGRASPHPLTADRRGTFNYAIDQGHVFFSGMIPPGTHQVKVAGWGGRSATTSFQVSPPGAPPPGGPPPGGPPPSGPPPGQ
jgi:hypothetical protein